MPAPDIVFAEGDYGPSYNDVLRNPDGTTADLTDCTITVEHRDWADPDADLQVETVQIVGAPDAGAIRWTPATARVAGDTMGEFVVTRSPTDVTRYPNDRKLWIHVRPRA